MRREKRRRPYPSSLSYTELISLLIRHVTVYICLSLWLTELAQSIQSRLSRAVSSRVPACLAVLLFQGSVLFRPIPSLHTLVVTLLFRYARHFYY